MIQKRINARSAITTFVFLLNMVQAFAGLSKPPLACTISGSPVSCVNQLEYYYTAQAPGYTYAWAVPFGGVLGNVTGPSTVVNWTVSGLQLVILTETAPGGIISTCSLTVNVYPRPTPKIFTDYISACQEPDPESGEFAAAAPKPKACWLVCENMLTNYWTTPEPGITYHWTVVGGSPASATGPSVNVTWGSPGAGSIILTATSAGGCSESITQCITIVASPKASFTFNNQTPDNPLKICLGETVYFNDLSQGASQWLWEFGDGTTSTVQNPSHDYPGPGTYSGLLTVKNNCGCSSTLPFEVIVNDRVSPEIGCISTLCLGECAFYTVTNINNCPNATIDWRIYGGKIVNNPVTGSVNVIWDDNDGFIDQNGYGLICVRITQCEGLCDAEVCVRVPIIHKARIIGPIEVCEGQDVIYYVPNQPGINEPGSVTNGVDFDWSISGNGSILSLPPYSNSITVRWFSSGTATVSLAGYENYLGDPPCQFEPDPITVTIKPTFTLSPLESVACVGQVQTINANGFGNFYWTISGPGGVIGPVLSGSSFAVSLNLPGTYVVTAQSASNDYCPNTPTAVIVANSPPPPPSGTITGVSAVCANTPYTYTISTPPPPGSIYVWTAQNGTVYGGGGQTVSVEWNGIIPMSLSVRTRSNLAPFCESDALPYPISLYVPPATFIDGPSTACTNQMASYEALSLSNYTDIQWSIIPATAGSVVTGQGTSLINVLFNSNAPGTVQIVATALVCGSPVTDTKTVSINLIPSIILNAPASACENSLVNLSVSPNTGIVSYNWNFGDGTTSTLAAPGHTWTDAGSFPVNVQLSFNICGNPTITVGATIQINPAPEGYITGSNGLVLCPPLTPSTDLTVATQFACTYLWNTFSTGPVITVSTPGNYCVTATEPGTGCASVFCTIVEDCISPPPCLTALDPWAFVPLENCDTYTFIPFPTVADFLYWDFGDGFLSFDPGVVSHTYAHVGYYPVTLYSYDQIQQCTLVYSLMVSVKFKGDFTANFDCSSGSMVTVLTDRSEYLPGFEVPPTWYSGTTSIGTGSVLTTTLTPGVHSIFLEVDILGMICTSPFQNVEAPSMPAANFTHNAPKCEGIPVQFLNTSSGGGLTSFSWNFGDGAASGLANPQRVYNAPPNSYTATLTVANDWGCSASKSQVITILDEGIAPTLSLTPTPPVCEGTPILITATSSLPAVTNYTWYNAAESFVPLQGPSAQHTFSTNTNGLYGVKVTDGNGCKYNVLAPEPVVITPPPYVNISGNTDACIGGTFDLSADIGPGFNYQWTITDPFGNTFTTSGPFISINAAGTGQYTFSVTITNQAAGCSNSGSTIGTVHPGVTNLSITASSNCAPAQLLANGTGIAAYNWSEGSTTQFISVAQGGQYDVVVSDQWGCTTKAEYFISNPPDLSNVMTGCYDFCSPAIWQAPNCQGCQYQWTYNGNPMPGETNATIKFKESGVYTVIVTNGFGCQSESGPIDISIVSEQSQCEACEIKIIEGLLVCRGNDPVTGQRIYEFWLDVLNTGGALNGSALQSDLGSIQLYNPTNGFIPGGGAITQLHGILLWNGTKDNGCFDLLGYLSKDCSDPKPCSAQWCTDLPPCCSGGCELKITKVKAVCLTKDHYKVSGTVSNFGCDLFDVYVETAAGNFPLTPSTILSGTSVTYSAIIAIQPGTYPFRVCGRNASGELCCRESLIKIPPCEQSEPCALEVTVNKFVCVGKTPDGFTIYDFQLSVFGVPLGYALEVVPQQIGYISSSSYNCFGANCTITGTYYHIPNSAGICLSVLALSPSDPPQVCLGQICLDEPKCLGRGVKSDPRNSSQAEGAIEIRDFSLIPNPATNMVEVWRTDETTEPFEVFLTDMYGRQLLVAQKVVEHGKQLDLSNLPAGVYIVTLKGKDRSLGSKKLVVGKQ